MSRTSGSRQALLIDLGSTSIKWATTDHDGTIIHEGRTPFPDRADGPEGIFEVPLPSIVDNVFSIIRSHDHVTDLMIATQMHGYVLADADMNPLTPYVSWQDTRAKGSVPDFDLADDAGVAMKDNLPRASVQVTLGNNPGIKEKARHFFTLGSYIIYRLTGRNVTHITDAAPSGYYSIPDFQAVNCDLVLPLAVSAMTPVGDHHGMNVYPAVGDQQASVFGSTAGPDEVILNLGTAAQMCSINPEPEKGDVESRPYFHGQRLLTVTGLPGGKVMRENPGKDLEEAMYDAWSRALKAMPERKRIVLIGGALAHHLRRIEPVVERLGMPVIHDKEASALKGLERLYKDVIGMERTIGIMIAEIAFPNMPLLLKRAGLQSIIIDNEHGPFDFGSLSGLVMNARLSGIECIVRLSSNDRNQITTIMDMGADGVLLPMTGTAEDILKVVRHAKYPPVGRRGISTMRAHAFYDPDDLLTAMKRANASTRVYAQIETKEGLDNLDAILSVDGVDGAYLGPNDLSADLEIVGQSDRSMIHDAIRKVAATATAHNKTSGIITRNPHDLRVARSAGVSRFIIGSELSLLAEGAKRTLRALEDI